MGKAISTSFMVVIENSLVKNSRTKMSWEKAAAVGLSGLTPREVAMGALTCAAFQKIPDPLIWTL